MEDDDRYTRITLRIPKELHSQLQSEADRTSKSLNAEIVARLTSSFEGGSAAGLEAALEMETANLARREEVLAMQIEMIRARVDNMRTRKDVLMMRIEALEALGDEADEDKLVQAREDAGEIINEQDHLIAELEALKRTRDVLTAAVRERSNLLERSRDQLLQKSLVGRPRRTIIEEAHDAVVESAQGYIRSAAAAKTSEPELPGPGTGGPQGAMPKRRLNFRGARK